jgi:Carbamoyltransferase C-terminus
MALDTASIRATSITERTITRDASPTSCRSSSAVPRGCAMKRLPSGTRISPTPYNSVWKMPSSAWWCGLFKHPKIRDVFAHPLCSDSGSAAGAALAACHQVTGATPERLTTLALGPDAANENIESLLRLANLEYSRPTDFEAEIARELAAGRVVGWYQGRMEAGQRALGQRSILADPRNVANRDKVNAIIKFREYWRPFCPSMAEECALRYFDRYTEAPYMIIAFDANDRLKAGLDNLCCSESGSFHPRAASGGSNALGCPGIGQAVQRAY